MKRIGLPLLMAILLIWAGCNKDEIIETEERNSLARISFAHVMDGNILTRNQFNYMSPSGDTFSVRTMKYFISRVRLHRSNGPDVSFDEVIYVDADILSSLTHTMQDKIPDGVYTGISFTLGFNPVDNQKVNFDSGAESLMFWPENMGGGYHFMKMEGSRIDNGLVHLYNLHTGGLDGEDYSINYELPITSTSVSSDMLHVLLELELMNWLQDPVDWDFEYFGPGIMGNHEAQSTIQKNGHNVFTAKEIQ